MVPGDGGSSEMERSAVVCIILAVTFVALAMFSYFYEPRSTGLLPVTTYPLRPYTIPFVIIGAILASWGIRMAWIDGKRRLVYNIPGAPRRWSRKGKGNSRRSFSPLGTPKE